MNRTLRLRREALAELGSDDLRAVAAGFETRQDSCHLTWNPCPSFDQCPTIPLRECPIWDALAPVTS